MRLGLLLLLMLFAAPVQRAMAWGQEGHSIVAELAQRRLTPIALNELSRLLGTGYSLASIASWADDFREQHKETTGWHFVNIPLAATNFDDTRDCTEDPKTREGDCIIHAIARSLATLSDTNRLKDERIAALRFLVHFIGDPHQPLHAVGKLRGYNQMPVCYFSGLAKNDCIPTNLHAVWDAGLIHSLYYDWGAYVDYLESSWIPQQDVQAAIAGNATDWALQSHEAARTVAVSNTRSGDMLGAQYLAQVRPILDRQLGLAGLRLASLLNGALSQTYVRTAKVLVISLFGPEADPWIKNLSLTQRIRVPELSPDFPDLLCNADDVCLLTTGMGHTNAAAFGAYCTTQQEDNAIFEALKRGAATGLIDLRRVADLRVAANFDRPYPSEPADTSLHTSSGGFPIACENIYRAGLPLVRDVVSHWSQWEAGVPP